MVYVGGEADPSLASDVCVIDVGFTIVKIAVIAHGIAIDSVDGMFRLAKTFAFSRLLLFR